MYICNMKEQNANWKTTFMILNPRLEAVQWNIWSLQIQQGQYIICYLLPKSIVAYWVHKDPTKLQHDLLNETL